MTTISEVPGSIEGEKILLTGLKISPQGRPIFTKRDNLVFQVSVSRRANGEITDEFFPLLFKIKPESKLEAGTKISGHLI